MLGSLFLSAAGTFPGWGYVLITLFPAVGIGLLLGFLFYKQTLRKRKEDAQSEFNRITEEARLEAKNIRQDAMLEAKEIQIRSRNEFENESRNKRQEFQKQELRLSQKEDSLQRKEDQVDKKLEDLEKSQKAIEAKNSELSKIEAEITKKNNQAIQELERISGLTQEEAKKSIIDEMEHEAKKQAISIIKDIEQKATEEGERKAKHIIALAIQRCGVDVSSESTASVVELPNDEMKGRIIGRTGRNIKALESATGVDFIIDDTPDVVTLSSFDPVRREIGRQTLNKLMADGRIHPGRIEEIADKVRKEMDSTIKELGENAVFEVNVFGIHPELVKLLGRLQYRTSYGQNVLKHSLEVAYIAGMLAAEIGADEKIAKRAGLLHDIGKAVDHEYEGTHIQIGVELTKKYKESEKVIHAIEAHHGDVEATTLEAILVQTADAISGSRPGARRESVELYVKRLEKLESIANSFVGVDQSYAIQAGREIRVIVKPESVDDLQTEVLARDIAKKLENELEYPGQIKVNVIRELRKIEYAK
ncbi:MAG: Ribonuclease Y [Firmicutes bacterium ADurb.Bin080]|jgi:ribonucrease Y|nr:ribonuclease Y [Clostridiales bacterium]OQC12385.1 MAG: Ribonuclease Y [Firmicutes bacterium ADurb.Bin080]